MTMASDWYVGPDDDEVHLPTLRTAGVCRRDDGANGGYMTSKDEGISDSIRLQIQIDDLELMLRRHEDDLEHILENCVQQMLSDVVGTQRSFVMSLFKGQSEAAKMTAEPAGAYADEHDLPTINSMDNSGEAEEKQPTQTQYDNSEGVGQLQERPEAKENLAMFRDSCTEYGKPLIQIDIDEPGTFESSPGGLLEYPSQSQYPSQGRFPSVWSEEKIVSKKMKKMPTSMRKMVSKLNASVVPRTPVIRTNNTKFGDHQDWYELLMGFLIVSNAVFMGVEVQYYSIHPRNHGPAGDIYQSFSIAFCLLFFLDLAHRMRSLKWQFFKNRLDLFDMLIVLLMICEEFVNMLGGSQRSIFDRVSILRCVRFFRLFRIIRFLRVMAIFRDIRLLLYSMQTACLSLVWTLTLCTIAVYFIGMTLTEGVTDLCVNLEPSSAPCQYFGTLFTSMLTLYESMFDGRLWGIVLESLDNEKVPYYYNVIFVAFILYSRIIMMNLVVGMLTQISQDSMNHERETIIQDEMNNRGEYVQILHDIFTEMDLNQNGSVSQDELEMALGDPRMDHFMKALQIDVHDAAELFELLDEEKAGAILLEEFILRCMRLRGDAKTLDIVKLDARVEKMMQKVDKLRRQIVNEPIAPAEVHKDVGLSDSIAPLARIHSPPGLPKSPVRSRVGMRQRLKNWTRRRTVRHSLINNVEDRSLTLMELQNVYALIMSRCVRKGWTDAATGEVLVPHKVNLYHFCYHYICPKSAPQGVVLHGLQTTGCAPGLKVEQINANGLIRIVADGFITSISADGDLKVRVSKGRFVDVTEHQGVCNVFVEGRDIGVPTSISLPQALSYKELVSLTPRKPSWYCSHWWGEAVFDFVKCIERHADLRRLSNVESGYWVCAYSIRQHELGVEVNVDIEQCSFVKAMRAACGVLLILDADATPFRRIWCDYELYMSLNDEGKMLDIVTVSEADASHATRMAHILTQEKVPRESSALKKIREEQFPITLLIKGICVKLEEGEASVSEDKMRILRNMANDFQDNFRDYETALAMALRRVNTALNGYFAQAAWPQAVRLNLVRDFDCEHPGALSLPQVSVKDESRETFSLNLSQLDEMRDVDLEYIAQGFPPNITTLHISLEGCRNISDLGVEALASGLGKNLKKIHLDFLGCTNITDYAVESIASKLPASTVDLRLDFAKCSNVTSAGAQELARYLTPLKLQSCKATFQGTQLNRNFADKSEILAMASSSECLVGHQRSLL